MGAQWHKQDVNSRLSGDTKSDKCASNTMATDTFVQVTALRGIATTGQIPRLFVGTGTLCDGDRPTSGRRPICKTAEGLSGPRGRVPPVLASTG